ncbi:hypothetical protein ABZX62_00925 [Streptomyces flavidovirens]
MSANNAKNLKPRTLAPTCGQYKVPSTKVEVTAVAKKPLPPT